LSDSQLAALAFQRLLPTLKEKYSAQEFELLHQPTCHLGGLGGKTLTTSDYGISGYTYKLGMDNVRNPQA
jgi:hypothetical protein